MRLNPRPLPVIQPEQITSHDIPRAESARRKGISNV
jgi:hypothetical protein